MLPGNFHCSVIYTNVTSGHHHAEIKLVNVIEDCIKEELVSES